MLTKCNFSLDVVVIAVDFSHILDKSLHNLFLLFLQKVVVLWVFNKNA